MSSKTCAPIDSLIQSSLESEIENLKLEWISCSNITNIEPTQIDNVYNATCIHRILILLGNTEECTPALVSEFARIYSLPTHEYKNDDNKFRRYSRWLESRNELIK